MGSFRVYIANSSKSPMSLQVEPYSCLMSTQEEPPHSFKGLWGVDISQVQS